VTFHWNKNSIPILQLGSDFFDPVTPAVFPDQKLRYWNPQIQLPIESKNLWNFKPLENNLQAPLALRYHGHQFQHYNPQIGDGRGFLYAQFQINKQWYDLGTKGSGQTPYSRGGDGRLTLKGAVREALATEMLESLGVDTSKTLCFFETGERLERGDEPSPTRSAVLTRLSRGHIRIGTFQRLAFLKQTENIKKLVSYCLNFYFEEQNKNLASTDDTAAAKYFLELVCQKNAALAAQIMTSGFVHGVLNTDNINISGELFDYGPYRFLPTYDPDFTAAYFDHQGLYAFGRQPHSILWNLQQLGLSLDEAHPELHSETILERFSDDFHHALESQFLRRLNLKSTDTTSDIASVMASFFQLMSAHKLLFEQTFFDFHSLDLKRLQSSPQNQYYQGKLFDLLMNQFKSFSVADLSKARHAYFLRTGPETLLIDEIESIWTAIDQKDDWSLFHNKLQSIRTFRGLYE